jgi:hypothetical protein
VMGTPDRFAWIGAGIRGGGFRRHIIN